VHLIIPGKRKANPGDRKMISWDWKSPGDGKITTTTTIQTFYYRFQYVQKFNQAEIW
jgi:hypothetical protein